MTLRRTVLSLILLATALATAALFAGCVTAPAPSTPPAAPQAALPLPTDAGTAIDRIIAAYGGRDALAKVQSYAFAGTLVDKANYHAESAEIPFARTFSRPDRLRIAIDRAEGSELRITDGNRGWRNSRTGGALVEVEGPPLSGMALQAARAALPWILEEKRATIRLAKPMKIVVPGVDGKDSVHQLIVLEIPLPDEMFLKVLVDESSYLVAGAGGYLKLTDPKPMFETHFERYVAVGGVQFPTIERTFAGPVDTGAQIITTVTLNPKLTGTEFKP